MSNFKTIGIVAAPELPTEISQKLEDKLPSLFSTYLNQSVDWKIEVISDPFAGVIGAASPILKEIEKRKKDHEWDYAICLTDLPIIEEKRLVIADVRGNQQTAVISLPSLGTVPMIRKLREAFVYVMNEMLDEEKGAATENGEKENRFFSLQGSDSGKKIGERMYEKFSSVRRAVYKTDVESQYVRFYTTLNTRGYMRLLSGMALANRPWMIFRSFKRVVAIAFATGAYGLIFPTLWMMSDAYGLPRFIAMMIVSMFAITAWVIIAHGLWEKPAEKASTKMVRLYNAATVLTLTVGVIFYYLAIFILFVLAVIIFIPSALLEENVGHAVTIVDYISIAWLTSSVATLAGAMGAGLESEETVLKATYSYRQRIRNEQSKERERKEEY